MKSNNLNNSNELKKNNKYYCKNCNQYGHQYKKCKEPIISYGVICFKIIDNETNQIIKYDNILENNNYSIKYLLIQRKHTLGYLEFIRGKYFLSDIYSVIILFRQMVHDEINQILINSFDFLWNELWKSKGNKLIYKNEYDNSKKKFNYLKLNLNSEYNLRYILSNLTILNKNKEWGIPKGRININETDIDCALREFREETTYNNSEHKLLNNFDIYTEIMNGTNGIKYTHKYYVSNCLTDRMPNNKHDSNEIGSISWFSYPTILNMIRPYHTEKKQIITDLHSQITSSFK